MIVRKGVSVDDYEMTRLLAYMSITSLLILGFVKSNVVSENITNLATFSHAQYWSLFSLIAVNNSTRFLLY